MRYIQLAGSRGKPSQSEEAQLLAPTSEQISAIQQFREKNRASKLFNHLSAISESIPALGWVAVAPTPAPYVKEMNDAGQFYTNRVLKEWKEKDQKHVEWCRAWVQLLSELQAYVKQYHTTGLVWSGKFPRGTLKYLLLGLISPGERSTSLTAELNNFVFSIGMLVQSRID